VSHCIGIRAEDKNRWERRVPLTPDQVGALVRDAGLRFCVQSSSLRVFPAEDYQAAGAAVVEGPLDCPVILGVKEIPLSKLQPGRSYVFFSHTIKGQPYNMPLLRKLMELGCSLFDYERIADAEGRRLVFFGRHAGLAGLMDSLWALGRRLQWEGLANPFAELGLTYTYADLAAAKAALRSAAARFKSQGVPAELRPFVVGFAGYGNVSQGAQELWDEVAPLEISPELLEAGGPWPGDPAHDLYRVVFREQHMVEPATPGKAFELQDYYDHPEDYRSRFARYLPHLVVLLNGIYWTESYPRLVSLDDLVSLFGDAEGPRPKLRVLGDVSCDVGGSVECTLRCTTLDDPVYVYDPLTGNTHSGVKGSGPVVLAVDNLPCELPSDASRSFGEVLSMLLPRLAAADMTQPFEALDLPEELRGALIVHRGELTPDYRYLEDCLEACKC